MNKQEQVKPIWNKSRHVNHQNFVQKPFHKKTSNYNRCINKNVKGTRYDSSKTKTKVNPVKALAKWVWKPKQAILEHVSKSSRASKVLTRYDYVDVYGRFKSILAWDFHSFLLVVLFIPAVRAAWLATLGPHIADYSSAMIKFYHTHRFLYHSFFSMDTTPNDTLQLPDTVPHNLATVLHGFSSVKNSSLSLPDKSKAQIETMVADMLTEGLIKTSTSPFSALVLLVRKKDEVDPAKATDVANWPIPTSVSQVCAFLGLTTFEKLKHSLLIALVLVLLDFSKPFIVEIDASGQGVAVWYTVLAVCQSSTQFWRFVRIVHCSSGLLFLTAVCPFRQRFLKTISHSDLGNNQSEDILAADSDTRPPMLDMTNFEDEIDSGTDGPYLGPKQDKVVADLSQAEKDRLSADIRATNILLQGCQETSTNSLTITRMPRIFGIMFTKLINDMRHIKITMPKIQLNSKFVNNMLPKWSRFMMAVKLNRGLKESNHVQLYAYLKQHELHANENKMLMERLNQHSHDPLALVSNVSPYQYPLSSSVPP
ncbi:hypothetical protein Tco_0322878 [Tanacetum coccineum]